MRGVVIELLNCYEEVEFMHRVLGRLLLGMALVTPVTLQADHEVKVKVKRYYDRDAKDWHEWNEREERAYRRYLEEKHMERADWARLRREQQREYWLWRHRNNDEILFGDRH